MNSGFEVSSCRMSVFAYAESAIHGHAALNIDWGNAGFVDEYGMQTGRGHRVAIMSIDGSSPRNLMNVGISLVPGNGTYPNGVGPLVMTGNYCTAKTSGYYPPPDHYNRFLVGTVWNDENNNELYDPDEGLGNVTVRPDQGSHYAVTSKSGGYAIPITNPGNYTITFAGAKLEKEFQKEIPVEQVSILVDLIVNKADKEAPDGDLAPLGQPDGLVNVADAMVCLRFVLGLETPTQKDIQHGDVAPLDANDQPDPDGRITLADALVILRKGLGLVSF